MADVSDVADELKVLREEVAALRKEVGRLQDRAFPSYPVAAPAGPNYPYPAFPVQPLPMPPYPFQPYYVPNTAAPQPRPAWEITCAAPGLAGDGGTVI